MAEQKITSKERLSFATSKMAGAGKWIILSGTATYFLSELLRLIDEISLPVWATLLAYAIINTLFFATSKYVEGQDK